MRSGDVRPVLDTSHGFLGLIANQHERDSRVATAHESS